MVTELELSNCFSINQLVGRKIILKKRNETSGKCESCAIVLNLKVDFFLSSDLPSIYSGPANQKAGFV